MPFTKEVSNRIEVLQKKIVYNFHIFICIFHSAFWKCVSERLPTAVIIESNHSSIYSLYAQHFFCYIKLESLFYSGLLNLQSIFSWEIYQNDAGQYLLYTEYSRWITLCFEISSRGSRLIPYYQLYNPTRDLQDVCSECSRCVLFLRF